MAESTSIVNEDYSRSEIESTVDWWAEVASKPSQSDENMVLNSKIVVPVFGWPGPVFYVIHVAAILSLGVSVLCSSGVLTYMTVTARQTFWKRPVAERLVVYLAICDLLFSLTHASDHVDMLATRAFPHPIACQLFAFFLMTFTLAQSIIVTYTALSAFVMVVHERRLSVGRWDWRLGLVALGLPITLVSVVAYFSYLGPSGAWCFVDMAEEYGAMLANAISIAVMATFFVNLACYLMVWLKIKQVSRAMAAMDPRAAENSRKYHRSARIMMLFVAVYIAQWIPYVIYSLWTFFGVPHLVMTTSVVLFTNMGGLFNFVAYTFVRRVGGGGGGGTGKGDVKKAVKMPRSPESGSLSQSQSSVLTTAVSQEAQEKNAY